MKYGKKRDKFRYIIPVDKIPPRKIRYTRTKEERGISKREKRQKFRMILAFSLTEQKVHKIILKKKKINIFSEKEMIMEGYCEDCSNYGELQYRDGLYLCSNCRYLRGYSS